MLADWPPHHPNKPHSAAILFQSASVGWRCKSERNISAGNRETGQKLFLLLDRQEDRGNRDSSSVACLLPIQLERKKINLHLMRDVRSEFALLLFLIRVIRCWLWAKFYFFNSRQVLWWDNFEILYSSLSLACLSIESFLSILPLPGIVCWLAGWLVWLDDFNCPGPSYCCPGGLAEGYEKFCNSIALNFLQSILVLG